MESQSYFSWYAIANAPLIMSTRVDTMDADIQQILQNKDVIAINQVRRTPHFTYVFCTCAWVLIFGLQMWTFSRNFSDTRLAFL